MEGTHSLFIEISLIILVATLVAGLMQLLRQPLIIGHIITGLIVGPQVLNLLQTQEVISSLGQFGIALLLFLVGLNLNPRVIKDVGRVSLIAGVGQIIITAGLGYWLMQSYHYSPVSSLIVAAALAFSSTIIILKLISDKKDLDRLYSRITLGILLVQDLAATLFLIFLPTGLAPVTGLDFLVYTVIRGAILFALMIGVTTFVLPHLSRFFARSQEFLFLFATAWGLGIASLFAVFGFSIEIGALLAGVALAGSPYHYEISSRLKPLRDFFIVLFFIILGTQISFDQLQGVWPLTILLLILTLVAKPVISFFLINRLDYNAKTSFKSAISLGQLSEFSLVLVVTALGSELIDQQLVSIITLAALISIALSSYLILFAEPLYQFLSPLLNRLATNHPDQTGLAEIKPKIIMFGYDQVGDHFIESFKKLGEQFLVIDYNPDIINELKEKAIITKYGDANDLEFLSEIKAKSISLIVSAITDLDTNLLITQHFRSLNRKVIIIVRSDTIEGATELYEAGATYVMIPHYLSSHYTSNLIDKHGFDLSQFIKERDHHLSYLEKHHHLPYHKTVKEP